MSEKREGRREFLDFLKFLEFVELMPQGEGSGLDADMVDGLHADEIIAKAKPAVARGGGGAGMRVHGNEYHEPDFSPVGHTHPHSELTDIGPSDHHAKTSRASEITSEVFDEARIPHVFTKDNITIQRSGPQLKLWGTESGKRNIHLSEWEGKLAFAETGVADRFIIDMGNGKVTLGNADAGFINSGVFGLDRIPTIPLAKLEKAVHLLDFLMGYAETNAEAYTTIITRTVDVSGYTKILLMWNTELRIGGSAWTAGARTRCNQTTDGVIKYPKGVDAEVAVAHDEWSRAGSFNMVVFTATDFTMAGNKTFEIQNRVGSGAGSHAWAGAHSLLIFGVKD